MAHQHIKENFSAITVNGIG